MTDILEREPTETVSEYAARMSDLIHLIVGIVHAEAGMLIDATDVLTDARWIVDHADDPGWYECWQLQLEIRQVIARMPSPTRLHRVLYFAKEMSR